MLEVMAYGPQPSNYIDRLTSNWLAFIDLAIVIYVLSFLANALQQTNSIFYFANR